jgi:hypothetical protein
MNALLIAVIRMTGRACLNHPDLVPFPGCQLVDLFVAILTLDFVDEVGAGVVFRGLSFVTSVAGDGFRVDLRPFGLYMSFGVGNVPMATITRERSMNGLCKLPLSDLFPVASEAFGVIDAFGAIFPSLNGNLFSLLCRFSPGRHPL